MSDTSSSTSQPASRPPIQSFAAGMKPFRHRVRVLTEVVNNVDEIAASIAAFHSMGWIVRPASKSEVRGYPAENRAWLVIEVGFNGYPRTAPRVAVRRIDEVIEKFRLGVWVRYAETIWFPQVREKTYYIDEMPVGWLRKRHLLLRGLNHVGIPRTTGLIRLPADAQETDARSALARYDLGKPFNPSRNLIRPAVSDSSVNADKIAASEEPPLPIRLAEAVTACILALLFGAASTWVSGVWKATPVFLGLIMTAPIALSMPGRTLTRRFYIGFFLASVITFAGSFLAYAMPDRKPSTFFGLTAISVALILIGRGVYLALGGSGITRHVSWLLPLSVTALVPFLLALGGMFDTEYLTYGFGIPANTVPVPSFLRLAVAARSVLIGLVIVFLIVGLIGWVRYFHWFDAFTRAAMLLMAIALAVFYLLASIGTGLSWVDNAAQSATAQARAGRQPSDYFGLQGILECIQPVTSPLSVYNGPLPIHRPVLSFGTTGPELWVWDPGSARAIGVPLQDVVAIPAAGTPAHC